MLLSEMKQKGNVFVLCIVLDGLFAVCMCLLYIGCYIYEQTFLFHASLHHKGNFVP